MPHHIQIAETSEECLSIYKFRYKIYVDELKKLHVNADHQQKLLFDEADRYMTLYYVTADSKLAATARSQRGFRGSFLKDDVGYFGISEFENFFDHDKIAIVDRLIVENAFRHTSLAHEMMLRIYIDGWQSGIRLCFITCDDNLLSMYIRYGFRIYQEPVLLNSGERRHKLLLLLCDKSHLKKVRSPFLFYLPEDLDDKGSYAALVEQKLSIDLLYQISPLKNDKVNFG
ncbi:MAG TPA: hypothetical protein VL442_06885 [Mucilaginibacter sp.]|jgi:predicted GNAT family N-acyltransferase|nr:hypothetical protein [Mucilaginibacter sp.]